MRRFLIQISVSYRWLYPNHALEVKRLTNNQETRPQNLQDSATGWKEI